MKKIRAGMISHSSGVIAAATTPEAKVAIKTVDSDLERANKHMTSEEKHIARTRYHKTGVTITQTQMEKLLIKYRKYPNQLSPVELRVVQAYINNKGDK